MIIDERGYNIRENGFTQSDFAQFINCSKRTVERWERSAEPISGPISVLIKMLEKYPEYVDSVMLPERTTPIRLWYMHNQTVCTIIDVDEMKLILKDLDIPFYDSFMIIEKTEGRMAEDDFWIKIER